MLSSDLAKLKEPFDPADIDWRPGATNREKTQALALAYLTSRAVMNRLDDVCGPQDWKDTFSAGPQGGMLCALSIRVDGEWIAKEDGGVNTEVEGVKGGYSEALKRAAVKWGVGRYLYELPNLWHPVEQYGNSVRFVGTPRLPQWALPAGATQTGRDDLPPMQPPPAKTANPASPEWWTAFRAACEENNVTAFALEKVLARGRP